MKIGMAWFSLSGCPSALQLQIVYLPAANDTAWPTLVQRAANDSSLRHLVLDECDATDERCGSTRIQP
jgi:hypothetical protein